MTFKGLEEVFLRLNAGKHFVALTYRLRRDTERHHAHVSCFVVEVADVWFLITAGHWIKGANGLEAAMAAGYTLEKLQLVDAFAGQTTQPLPITFEISEWVAMYEDDKGVDFAALPLNPIFRKGLESGGVTAIEMQAMGPAQFHDDSQLVLAGVPTESLKLAGGEGTMKFMLVPLTAYTGHDLEAKGESVLAKMAANPEAEEHRLEDAAGMSGCPVFRIINKANHKKKYWLVGIQSGWYSYSRVVRFCPVDQFTSALEDGTREFVRSHGRLPGTLT